jgi:small conductance mechanosensitive channel
MIAAGCLESGITFVFGGTMPWRLEQLVDLVNPTSLKGALFYAALLVALALLGSRTIGVLARAALAKSPDYRRDPTAILFLQALGRIVVWLAAVVIYAHLIPELRVLGTALLAGASVASIVAGFAAQNTLGNAIAGLSLLLYHPFRVGDRLQVPAPSGPETGTVESVTLAYTILRTFDNRRVVLPNSIVANETIINLSTVDPRVMAVVPIGVGYTADLGRARAILLELAHASPDVQSVEGCPVVQLGDSSVTLSLRAWCSDAVAAKRFEYNVYEQAKKRFDEERIEIPYPYRNVLVKREA